jgi:hypothetical protein
MKRFVEAVDRGQSTLLPECLDDFIDQDNPVRVVDVFVDELDLGGLGFAGVDPKATGRPAYHPSDLLKLYIYGYLNRVQSSRRLEREAGQQRLDEHPEKMRQRRETVEHPFGTIKYWMGATHFQMKTLKKVGTEMALHVLAYNLKRVMNIMGGGALIAVMSA